MKVVKVKYTPEKLYNKMREILRKYWKRKRFLGLRSIEYISDFTNYDTSESNIKCEECTRQLWNGMKKICY